MIARLASFLGRRPRAVQPRTNQSGLRNLYVVRLDDAVLRKRKFRERNPNYRPGKPCVYVGQTWLDPEIRFQQHQDGYKASRIVRRHGQYLMRKRYEHLNPVPAAEAEDREEALATAPTKEGLRSVVELMCSDTITTAATRWPGNPPSASGPSRLRTHSGPSGHTEQGNRMPNRVVSLWVESACWKAEQRAGCPPDLGGIRRRPTGVG